MPRLSPALAPLAVFASLSFAPEARAGADTHTVFLNDCKPSGCTIHAGTTNATTDTSDIAPGTSTVSAFGQSAAEWQSIDGCVKDVLAAYDVNVTEQRPASGDYYELVIAGSPTQLGLPSGQLEVGDTSCTGVGSCSAFLPNALGFTFANIDPGHPDDVCAAAVHSVATTWALEQVVDSSDVMSFAAYTGIRHFHDAEACGGDCSAGGTDPFGQACTGSGASATHPCIGNGSADQDENQAVLALFGPSPVVAITAPAAGSTVDAGFAIETTCTSGSGVQSVAIGIDGTAGAITLSTSPYDTVAPQGLPPGTHSIVAVCTSVAGRSATTSRSVTLAGGGAGKSKGCGCDLESPARDGGLALYASLLTLGGALALRRRRRSAG